MILITGGTGFIGGFLMQQLLASGKKIRAIKRKSSVIPKAFEDIETIEWVEADLIDYFSLEDAFQNITEVYHCAAIVSFDASDKKQINQVNVDGTTHIVNLCLANQARLVYVSSVAALGSNEEPDQLISEKTAWIWDKNKGPYSISKYEAEREVWRGIAEGLDAVIVNPSIVIGPFDDKTESGKLFTLIEKGFKFYPKGTAGFVNVRDVAKIMVLLMERRDITGESFILNASNSSYHTLFSKYAALIGQEAPNIPISKRVMGIAWRFVAIGKALGIGKGALTKEIAQSSNKSTLYSNQKLVDTLHFSFTSLEDTLNDIVSHNSFTKNTKLTSETINY